MSGKPVRAAGVAQRAEATRAALLAAARTLFVAKGFHATSTEEIVAAAGVGTRGALYHHFADKRGLFLAVFEATEQELLAAASAASAGSSGGAFASLRRGLMDFLDASLTPEVQRILLIDGPAVLGWHDWKQLEQRYGLGAIQGLLEQAVAEGSLPDQPVRALAHILLAAVDEAALFIAHATSPTEAKAEAVAGVNLLLDGLASQRPRS
jgi:AcrR family transcriptional regulator